MIQLSTNAENTVANRAATPPAIAPSATDSQPSTLNPQPTPPAPPASQPATSNLQLGTTRAADSQPSTLNSQPLFPQSTGESDRAFEAFRAYLELGPQRRYAVVGRKVGVCYRTVSRWARDFDWRGRIKACSAQLAGQYLQTERDLQREQLLDAAARAKSFRERQCALAETLLDAAERHLEVMDADDPDQMSFSDACKALELASRLAAASGNTTDPAAAPGRSLEDQLTTLLDQACSEAGSQNDPAAQPASTSCAPKTL